VTRRRFHGTALGGVVVGILLAGCAPAAVRVDVVGMPSVTVPARAMEVAPSTTTLPTTLPPTTLPPTTLPPPPTTQAPAPCAVSFVGDSLGLGTLRNGLTEALGGVGCMLVWKEAYGGMPIGVGADLLAGAGGAPANIALVILGFHNARSEVGKGRFPRRIDAVVQAAGARLVVWPMLASTADCSNGYKDALVRANQELQAATLRWPNLVLADYPAFLAGHPEFSENRCPHLVPPGYGAAAAWPAGEVRRLLELRTP